MDRRQFVAGVTVLPAGIAGCFGLGDSLDTPSGVTIETQHWSGSYLADDDLEPFGMSPGEQKNEDFGESPRSSQTVFTTQSTALARIKEFEEIEEFVRETDFIQSYLVVVVAGVWSSDYWLELQELNRTNQGIDISVGTRSPSGSTVDDLGFHTLAIRITDEEKSVPERVAIEVNGEPMGTVKPE